MREQAWWSVLGAGVVLAVAGASCSRERFVSPPGPTYDADVASILEARCASCHSGAAPAAGWSATTYLEVIGCVAPSGAPATVASPGGQVPLLGALATPPHQGLLTSTEAATVASWVAAGAPAFAGTVHPPGIVDPRSSDFHGTALRAARWAPMLDATNDQACGRCHDGTSSRPPDVTSSAPGATACTTCHDQPGGILACGTCHGDGARAYPPRNACFFPQDAANAGAHAEHVEASTTHIDGFSCGTCHPVPGNPVISGLHGDGAVDVVFDTTRVTPEASYDPTAGQCAVSCHDLGGAKPRPIWSDPAPATCNGCHGSPPADHFPGPCSECHKEANADGTALSGGPLHMNGKVDLGDGSGGCGACHGSGADPWPSTAAHPSHKTPTLTLPIDCASCHPVPSEVLAPGHLDGVVNVTFTEHAVDRNQSPTWDAPSASCQGVACHGAGLIEPVAAPVWTDASGKAGACGACHGIPPTEQHTASTDCQRSTCHGTEITATTMGPTISPGGKALHINGVIDVQ